MNQKSNQRPSMEPYFGRDEMNLVEFPLGPIGKTTKKTLEVDHVVFDKKSKREVTRRLVITGSDAFGLPKPGDDGVLIGLMALTHESGYADRKVHFSRHRLCEILGCGHDGRAYQRFEDSLDRLTGTTFKFKNSWFDKGEKEWRSHSFHLIDNFELCYRERYDNARKRNGKTKHSLCYFVWNDVIWKSLTDGYIKKVDMKMFRRIANGRRREAPLRLYRWLDKQFYPKERTTVSFDVMSLCNGTIGYSHKYLCDAKRSIERAAGVLIDCGFLDSISFSRTYRGANVIFRKAKQTRRTPRPKRGDNGSDCSNVPDRLRKWLADQNEEYLFAQETKALAAGFGRKLHHDIVSEHRSKQVPILESSRIRQLYIREFIKQSSQAKTNASRNSNQSPGSRLG